MNVVVQSTTLPITEGLRRFVERQVTRLMRKGQQISTVMVFLEQISGKKNDMGAAVVKFCVTMPGKTLCVKRHANDMYTAIVDTAERTNRSLRKMKEKRMLKHRMKRVDWALQAPGLAI
jgi:ribosomal subunit interface protein